MGLGDYAAAQFVDALFTTRYGSVPTALVGGAISVYRDNSLTQSTTGVTLIADFDGVTGLNQVRLDLSADATFYAAGHSFMLVLTAGTVGGVAVAGTVIDDFSIQDRYSVPTDLSAIAASLATLAGYVDTEVAAIKAKTDNLPSDPADQSLLEAAIAASGGGAGGGNRLVIT